MVGIFQRQITGFVALAAETRRNAKSLNTCLTSQEQDMQNCSVYENTVVGKYTQRNASNIAMKTFVTLFSRKMARSDFLVFGVTFVPALIDFLVSCIWRMTLTYVTSVMPKDEMSEVFTYINTNVT